MAEELTDNTLCVFWTGEILSPLDGSFEIGSLSAATASFSPCTFSSVAVMIPLPDVSPAIEAVSVQAVKLQDKEPNRIEFRASAYILVRASHQQKRTANLRKLV